MAFRDGPREDFSNRFTGAFYRGDAENRGTKDHMEQTMSAMLGEKAKVSSTESETVSSASTVRCDGCNRPIAGGSKYVEQNSKKYHETCVSLDSKCGRCSKPILSGAVHQVMSKSYHPACFTCVRCSAKLTGGIVERNGDLYCSSCGNTPTATRSVPAAPTSSGEADNKRRADAERRNAEEKDIYQNVQKGKSICVECARVIDGEYFSLNDALYHAACFKCTKCKGQMSAAGVIDDEGELVCEGCVQGRTYKAKCATCLKPLEGSQWVKAPNGHSYHKECFVCAKCQKPFEAGGFVERDGRAFHPACAGPAAVTKTLQAPTTTAKGFTIDPRTGQKKWNVGV